MKKVLFLVVATIIFILGSMAIAQNLQPPFDIIKQIALTTKPDGEGDYIIRFDKKDYQITIAYLVKEGVVGIGKTIGYEGVAVFWWGAKKAYGIGYYFYGQCVGQEIVTKEEAIEKANIFFNEMNENISTKT